MATAFDVDAFVASAAKLCDEPEQNRYLTTTLPNSGEELAEICSTGLNILRQQFGDLADALNPET